MKHVVALAAAVALVLSGCGDSPTPPNPDITEGEWSGWTFNADLIVFGFHSGTIDTLQADVVVEVFSDTVTWYAYDIAVTSNQFFYSESTGTDPRYFWSIQGTFVPPDSVHGVFTDSGVSGSTSYADTSSWDGSPR